MLRQYTDLEVAESFRKQNKVSKNVFSLKVDTDFWFVLCEHETGWDLFKYLPLKENIEFTFIRYFGNDIQAEKAFYMLTTTNNVCPF